MSPLDPQIPPAGEEIHLPGPSADPLLLTIAITTLLIGVTTNIILVIVGLVLALWVMGRWIAGARRDIAELPAHHEHH